MSEKQAKAMKKSKSTCRCNEELDIMCQNCVARLMKTQKVRDARREFEKWDKKRKGLSKRETIFDRSGIPDDLQ
jgi:hypothetical protein